MAGNATTTDHMPTPPIVLSSTATASRNHAVMESVGSGLAGLEVVCAGFTGEFIRTPCLPDARSIPTPARPAAVLDPAPYNHSKLLI
jgi:hypothetical protein